MWYLDDISFESIPVSWLTHWTHLTPEPDLFEVDLFKKNTLLLPSHGGKSLFSSCLYDCSWANGGIFSACAVHPTSLQTIATKHSVELKHKASVYCPMHLTS